MALGDLRGTLCSPNMIWGHRGQDSGCDGSSCLRSLTSLLWLEPGLWAEMSLFWQGVCHSNRTTQGAGLTMESRVSLLGYVLRNPKCGPYAVGILFLNFGVLCLLWDFGGGFSCLKPVGVLTCGGRGARPLPEVYCWSSTWTGFLSQATVVSLWECSLISCLAGASSKAPLEQLPWLWAPLALSHLGNLHICTCSRTFIPFKSPFSASPQRSSQESFKLPSEQQQHLGSPKTLLTSLLLASTCLTRSTFCLYFCRVGTVTV